ncbi:hypothetical protein DQ04_20771000 [Trypanosoma grayi]|uniref:hypothetical protein n=1 Tax=Trypanosoma grayi TaxID=71804 RepID=UPI0004F440F9|nr:hypothetical protein DQ04_20771000 [Trypanosoma grayi]KEG05534.1 hypothetical protein DQ04_20771000 [Trypanosoma grayi]
MMRAGGVMMVRRVLLVLALCCACVCVTAAAEPGKAAVQNSGTSVAQQKVNINTEIKTKEESVKTVQKAEGALKTAVAAVEAVEKTVETALSLSNEGIVNAKAAVASATEAGTGAGTAFSELTEVYDALEKKYNTKNFFTPIENSETGVKEALLKAAAAATVVLNAMQKATEAESKANWIAEKALAAVEQAQDVSARAKEAASDVSAAATNTEGAALKAKEAVQAFTKAVESAEKAAVEVNKTAAKAQEVSAKAKEAAWLAKKAADYVVKDDRKALRKGPMEECGAYNSLCYTMWYVIDKMDRIYFAKGLANQSKEEANAAVVEGAKLVSLAESLAESLRREYEAAKKHVAKGKSALEDVRAQAETELKRLQAELQTLKKKQKEIETQLSSAELPTTASADVPKVDPKELIKNKNADSSSSSAWVCAPLLVLVCVLSCSIAVW